MTILTVELSATMSHLEAARTYVLAQTATIAGSRRAWTPEDALFWPNGARCLVVDGVQHYDGSMLYIGHLNAEGYYNGPGDLFSFDEPTHHPIYTGDFVEGVPHGHGQVLYDTGQVACDGAFTEGVFVYGKLFSRDGRPLFEGPFVDR